VFVSGSLNTSSYIKDNVEKTSVSVIAGLALPSLSHISAAPHTPPPFLPLPLPPNGADDITFMSFKKKEEGHEETEDKHKSGVDHL